MIPAAFDYVRASSLDEALTLLGRPGVKAVAGGQSLLPLMKLRLARPESLVDIGRLGELRGIRTLEDGRLAVGALTTYAELMDSPAMSYGLLRDALPGIGDVQVRNLGTVGGSLAHCDPASDLPACFLALEAEIVIQSSRGKRSTGCGSFFQGAFATDLEADELVTEVTLPGPRDDTGSAYVVLEQPASGYAMVGVAAVVSLGSDGTVSFSRIALTGVGEAPYRAVAVEEALTGSDGSAASIQAAATHATDGQTVNSDIHAGADYRSAMAVVYTRRAIEAALARLA
jgi:aerobic carbon-monoxide dehydrogenase medium subunit